MFISYRKKSEEVDLHSSLLLTRNIFIKITTANFVHEQAQVSEKKQRKIKMLRRPSKRTENGWSLSRKGSVAAIQWC